MAVTFKEYKENEIFAKAWHDYLVAVGKGAGSTPVYPPVYVILRLEAANPGDTFAITGKSTNPEWWRIDYIDASGQHMEGWIWNGNVSVTSEGTILSVDDPQYIPPCTPTPTNTPIPTNTPVPTETFTPVPPTPTYTPIPASYQLFSSGVDD